MTAPRRRRVNHWSPWGADASGIANYASHLVPALDAHVDVTIVHPSEVDAFYRTITPAQVVAPTLDDGDVNVFHVGNHLTYHHWMIGPLMRHGGLVVLHDWSLFDLMRPLFYRSLALWHRELRYNHEPDPNLAAHRQDPGFLMAHPMNRRILEAADVVITLTPWARDHALELHPHLDVRYVPLAGPQLDATDIPSDAAVTVLGGIGKHKQVDVAIDAFALVAQTHPGVRLRIVGRGDDRAEIAALRARADRLGIGSRVEWHLDVLRERYLELVAKSLVVVVLRGDTAGEMSAAMAEAWAAGRVAITSDQPQFREFDPAYCRRVPVGAGAVSALAEILGDAVTQPVAYQRDGRLARDSMAQGSSFECVAASYAGIIDEIVSTHRLEVTSGLNVLGSWGTSSGLAEGARRLGTSLIEHQVPITMPWAFKLPGFDVNLVPHHFGAVDHEWRYAINLWTANINEFHVVDRAQLGSANGPRWNIASWIYEFPEIPDVLVERFSLVDEIWAGSDFAGGVFRQYFDGPIMTLPYVVEARGTTIGRRAARERFNLRASATVVMFSFDFASGWARKNPLAVIAAFKEAAAATKADAQLVMKVSGLSEEYGQVLVSALDGVDAVLVDAHLSNAELGDLFHAIDVYCSLHRAEGFGLGLAEAMALGKLAVATDYSGNLDFMNESNSLLVSARPSTLTHADTESNPGMRRIIQVGTRWVEPDHDAAVAALTRAFDPAVRVRLGAKAAADIARGYSADAVAEVVARRLSELTVELDARRTAWPSRGRT